MNPERPVEIVYGPVVPHKPGHVKRTISKVVSTPQGTKTTVASKEQRWKHTPTGGETKQQAKSRRRVKAQSLERALTFLNSEQEAGQEEIDDLDERPDLPPDVPGDFAFDIDLLEARRELQSLGQVNWEAVRVRLEELQWSVPLMLGPGSGDAAVQRYLLQQRADKHVKCLYLAARRVVDAVAARVRERACDRGLACVRAACRVSARGSEPLSGGSFGGQCGVQRPES